MEKSNLTWHSALEFAPMVWDYLFYAVHGLLSVVDQSYRRLLLRVRNDRGLDLSSYKEAFILRRLRSRFRALNIDNLDAYTNILKRNPEEYVNLVDVLAINVTEFFRDPSLYEFFSKTILREILKKKIKSKIKTLRILSAGGATGEEPYSIAIALCETLGKNLADFSVSIHSVDIDEDCVRKTKDGIYRPDRLRNAPPEICKKYFSKKGDLYEVKPIIKKLVRTYKLDLLTERIPRHFDVIFCRNVLIYFSKEAHTNLFVQFHASLPIGGFLILGRTETLIGLKKGLFKVFDARERVFRKENPRDYSPTSK